MASRRCRLFYRPRWPSHCGWTASICRLRLCGSRRLDGSCATNSSHPCIAVGVLDCIAFGLSFSSTADAAAASAATVGCVLLVDHRSCECGNLVGQGLDLCDHCVCQCLCAVADVACLFSLGNCCLRDPSNVLAQFIAAVGTGCLVCAFVVVFATCPAAVLLVDLIVFDEPFKIRLSFAKIVLVGFRLVFLLCHLFFVGIRAPISSRLPTTIRS